MDYDHSDNYVVAFIRYFIPLLLFMNTIVFLVAFLIIVLLNPFLYLFFLCWFSLYPIVCSVFFFFGGGGVQIINVFLLPENKVSSHQND